MTKPRKPGQRYTDEEKARISSAILARMDAGQTAFKSCEAEGVPYVTFNWWCNEQPALAEAYARAKEGLIARMAQELADIADEPPPLGPDGKVDSGWIQKHRLQVDTRKWLLSKLAPKKYGDRLEVAGDASAPLQAAVTVSFVTATKKGDE